MSSHADYHAMQWSLAALETLMDDDHGGQLDQHGAVLRGFTVVELWRLRRVCRAFRRWGTAALAALPRVVAVGGRTPGGHATAGVEVLDLSTLRWSSGVVPALPEPRHRHALCAFADGRVVVAGGWRGERTALQWMPGAAAWAPLPDTAEGRLAAAAVALPDGRAMVIGGKLRGPLASVEVLAADGSGWSALAPMPTARDAPTAAVLPSGKVLVAGGCDDGFQYRGGPGPHKTAELWDPATGAWTDLRLMAAARDAASGCVLPSGRVAVVGGVDGYNLRRGDGEAIDPEARTSEARTWQPLPQMAHGRSGHAVVAVPGGLLAVGGRGGPAELFDEASNRWFELPHPMAQPRDLTCAASLPAAALAAQT